MKDIFVLDTPSYIDQTITIYGWVAIKRDHRKVIFLDVRDRTGIVQVVGDEKFKQVSPEDVIKLTGLVKKRPEKLQNPNIATGNIEIEATNVEILSKANTIPIPIDTDGYEIDEEKRLHYRYLDLRRPRMVQAMEKTHQSRLFIRNYLTERRFLEIDTPILTKTTPEGARDFLVPSRLQKGMFYALPQSPQQYKQLLMVAGVERYFQFARCFRDEDPRVDRAYGEFTQLDIEMSFVTQEDILVMIEDMFTKLVQNVFPEKHITKSPWPRIPHAEAIKKHNSDKPDLRNNPDDPNELAFAWTIDFPLFTEQSDTDYFHGSGKAKFAPSHHMFTSPHPDDVELLESDPMNVRGLQHDLVLNGLEVGGGSIRIHNSTIQQKIFDLIGFSEKQKQEFNHMLEAFSYGVPPHGGIAPGIDRFMMAVLGEQSIREVLPFPSSSGGRTAVMNAPSTATREQLSELHIQLK